jgi:PAS domain S-box-containing protein
MIRALVWILVAAGVGLVVLLSRATANTTLFEQHYPWLLGLGLAVSAGMLLLIGYQIRVLWKKLKERVFGSKLALRLMAVFALMAIIPGGLVYAISLQFFERSIESWFSVRVDKALEGGLNLGRGALDGALAELGRKAGVMATELADRAGREDQVLRLRLMREQHAVEEVSLFNSGGKPIAFSGVRSSSLFPELPAAVINSQNRQWRVIETLPERGLFLRAVTMNNAGAGDGEVSWLQVLQPVSKVLAQDAQAVESGYKDYQELSLARSGLKWIFRLTLTLALLLTLFSAIALSFLLSERFSAPLSALAESTRAIAKGDFSKLNPVKSRDEFGVLTQSFNTMTRQLAEASEVVARNQQQLENAKTYLESILVNLSAGVMAFDEQYRLKTMNAAAMEILGAGAEDLHGHALPMWSKVEAGLAPLVDEIIRQFSALREKTWERQIDFARRDGIRTLLVRGTRMPATIDSGLVVVFDDITHLIQAQRDAAWGEVARRLAHEIKNPLTPIQLSAERLQHKLEAVLPALEADILRRSTSTIVAQVNALKGMVDDFSLYARSAQLNASDVALNDLVRDVLTLYESMQVRLETHLAADLPRILADPALLRQVLHNLMQNAIDAMAGVEHPHVVISTLCAADGILITVTDTGTGIAESVMGRIFEPYVTTKPKGTGLGMAIVKKIIDEHHGRISVENVKPHGASVSITLPLPHVSQVAA